MFKIFREIKVSFVCLAGLLFCTSCVTIFEPTTQNLAFDTEPSGANMYYDNGTFIGQTPVFIDLEKGKTFKFIFKKEGYKDEKYALYKGTLRMDVSYNCKIDFYYGWLLLGVPIAINRWFSPKSCNYFYKDEYMIKMTEIKDPNSSSAVEDSKNVPTQASSLQLEDKKPFANQQPYANISQNSVVSPAVENSPLVPLPKSGYVSGEQNIPIKQPEMEVRTPIRRE